MHPRWKNIKRLVEVVASGLEPDAPFHITVDQAADLYTACVHDAALPTSPAPAAVTRAFAGMASSLASLAAALARKIEPGVHVNDAVLQCNASCFALNGALELVQRRQLQLSEQDCMRLLSAAATISLDVALRQVPSLIAHATRSRDEKDVRVAVTSLEVAMYVAAKVLQLCLEHPTPLPPRVAAAVQASQLTPQQLKRWTESIVHAAGKLMAVSDSCRPPRMVPTLLRNLVACGLCPELRNLVRQDARMQLCILQMAALVLVLPEQEQVAAVQDPNRCLVLRDLIDLIAASCLSAGRWQMEINALAGSNGGSNDGGGSDEDTTAGAGMLAAVVALATALQLHAPRGLQEQAALLVACTELLAVYIYDAAVHSTTGVDVPVPHLKAVVQHLGQTALPLLCQLAAEVAAHAPAPGSFGALCWSSLAREWEMMLSRWSTCITFRAESHWAHWVLDDGDCCTALAQAAEALLRLAPLLPLQPAEQAQPGVGSSSSSSSSPPGWRSIGQVVAESSPAWQDSVDGVQQLPRSAQPPARLAVSVAEAAHNFLLRPPTIRATTANTTAAFHTAATACRYVHAFMADLQPSSNGARLLAAVHGIADVDKVLNAAATKAVHLACQLAVALPAPGDSLQPDPWRLMRWIECCVLLYLQAVAALPPIAAWGCTQDSMASRCLQRIALLQFLMSKAEAPLLQPLWQQLLRASGQAAAGLDVVRLITDACRTTLEVGDTSMPQPLRASLQMVVSLMLSAAGISPAALAGFAADAGLLRALSCTGRQQLIDAHPSLHAAQQGDLCYLYAVLLRELAGALPGADPAELARVQQALACMWIDAASGRAALDAFDQLMAGLPPPAALSASPPPLAAEVRELAVRRAKALAECRCSNPRCTNLAGVSEAAAKGRRCSGCRVARYCSQECSVADWKLHKLACKALREEAADGCGG